MGRKVRTEKEWLTCSDPVRMLTFVRGKASPRKLRLFACACVRRVWHLLAREGDQGARKTVQMIEHYVDGLASKEAFDALLLSVLAEPDSDEEDRWWESLRRAQICACLAAEEAEQTTYCMLNHTTVEEESVIVNRATETAKYVVAAVEEEANTTDKRTRSRARRTERLDQGRLLRELVGNPFRPVVLDPAWRTRAIVGLAQSAYDERSLPAGTLDPARLAVLADALEDAGCNEAAILDHCRGPGPHVRGCWALDLLLAKS